MEIPEQPIGAFCWLALSTPDLSGAADFYGELFGWRTVRERPFSSFWVDDKMVGSLVNSNTDDRTRGQPPNWMPFVRVRNVDIVIERALQLGGDLWFPAYEAPGARIGLIRGITREILGLWQHLSDPPIAVPAPVATWYELATPDPEPAKRFYQSLFGWRFTNEGAYTVLTNGAHAIGGVVKMAGDWEDYAFLEAIGQAPGEKFDVPPHWMIFFTVRDCEEVVRRAEALGARIATRPDDLHTFGQFAVIRDPQGAYFSVLSRL